MSEKFRLFEGVFGGTTVGYFGWKSPRRKLAIILERESQKWFKPALGQFQIFYKSGVDQREYQPDFVAESSDAIHILEPKRESEMNAADVLAKRDAAVQWCEDASQHALSCGGKPWSYALIPHDAIAENMTLRELSVRFGGTVV